MNEVFLRLTNLKKSVMLSFYDRYDLGLPPTQDSSRHQDYYIFRIGNPYKPSFATVTGWGVDPRYDLFGGM